MPESKNIASKRPESGRKNWPSKKKGNSQGLQSELFFSAIYHLGYNKLPLLISPEFLRRRGGGQIDMAYMVLKQKRGSLLQLFELKSRSWVQKAQQRRLVQSAAILSSLFKLPSRLEYVLDMKENFAKKHKLL